jgi:hypothetical protein
MLRTSFLLLASLITAAEKPVPARPLPPEAVAVSATSIVLRWTSPADNGHPILGFALYGGALAEHFRPLYGSLLEGTWSEPERRNFTVHGLIPHTPHVFCLYAWNHAGRSEASDLTEISTSAVDATISVTVPLAGPVHGGTRLLITGSDLAFGSVYKCRLGAQVVPATFSFETAPRVASSGGGARSREWAWDADDAKRPRAGAIECLTPAAQRPRASLPSGHLITPSSFAVPIYVSLDGTWLRCPIHTSSYSHIQVVRGLLALFTSRPMYTYRWCGVLRARCPCMRPIIVTICTHLPR